MAAVVKANTRRRQFGRAVGLAAVLALAISATAARAHPEVSAGLVNRYLTIVVDDARIEIFFSLLFGPLPAAERRRNMDRDGNGQLSPEELAGEEARVGATAKAQFSLSVDGVRIELNARATMDVGLESSTGAAPLVVELRATHPLSVGEHVLRIEPGRDPERLGETETTIETGPGWLLAQSRSADEANSPSDGSARSRFRFDGPRVSTLEDRSVTFVVRPMNVVASDGNHHVRTPWRLALGVAALGVCSILAWRLRRRYRKKTG